MNRKNINGEQTSAEKRCFFSLTPSKMCVIFFFVSLAVLLYQAMNVVLNQGVSLYSYGFHFVDFSLGFIPRALYGATLGKVTCFVPQKIYFLFWFLLMWIPYIFFFVLYWKRVKEHDELNILDFFLLFVFSLPTTFLPAIDFLRLDILNFGLFFLCGYALWLRHWSRFLTPFIVIAMTLIHEGALFMFIPALCGIAIYRIRKQHPLDWYVVILACIGSAGAALLYWIARNAAITGDMLEQLIRQNYPYSSAPVSWNVSWFVSSTQHGFLRWVIQNVLSWHWLWCEICSIPFVAVVGYVFYFYWKNAYLSLCLQNMKEKIQFLILALAPFSNIFLFIGCDYNRWIWAFFSVHIVILFLLYSENPILLERKLTQGQKYGFVLLCLLFLAAGAGDGQHFCKAAMVFSRIFSIISDTIFPNLLSIS